MHSSSLFFSSATKPALMVLQNESLLLKFTPDSRLPINLETNHVRTCACLSIYSPKKGIAYLSHIDPRMLDDNHFQQFICHIEDIIDAHGLNKNNTFVSLVGGQDRSLNESENYKKGIYSIRNYLNKKFDRIHEHLGGDNKIERSVELSPDFLKFVTFDFMGNIFWLQTKQSLIFDGNVQLKYQEEKIPFSHDKKGELLAITYRNYDNKFIPVSNHIIGILNKSLHSPSQYSKIRDMQRKSMKERCEMVNLDIDNTNIYLNKTVSKIVSTFDLDSTHSPTVSNDIFSCMIQNNSLIHFLKKHLDFKVFIKLNFTKINNLGLCSVKKLIENKLIKPEQLWEMTDYANTIFKNINHYTLLLNNMKIEDIAKLKSNNQNVREILSKLDSLLQCQTITSSEIKNLTFDDVNNIYNKRKERQQVFEESIESDINYPPVVPVQEKYRGCPIRF